MLAKAVCQATQMLNFRPLSRASPLPQGIWGAGKIGSGLEPFLAFVEGVLDQLDQGLHFGDVPGFSIHRQPRL
ncbi:hypothetical protein SAMN05660659_04662 [Pseudomonas sp. LAMO17WK12:I6]|nr:hypothetical protein SAMN05660659_04662 [Pseudomonas sp. LAMO17WK12:I6]